MIEKNGLKVLERADFEKFCSSFYAVAPKSDVSEKYAFINTRDVAVQLYKMGWMPVFAREARTIDPSNKGVTKHIVRFAHQDLRVGGERIELVAVNSHNRASSLQISAGVFRQVCSNGLVVQMSNLDSFSIRHIGNIEAQVHEAVQMVAENAGQISGSIKKFKDIELTLNDQHIYALAAHSYLYPDADKENPAPIYPEQLLRPRRSYDRGDNLWLVYNRVQENIMKGGVLGKNSKGGRMRTRAIKSIDKDVKLNKALWVLADAMAKQKVA